MKLDYNQKSKIVLFGGISLVILLIVISLIITFNKNCTKMAKSSVITTNTVTSK